MIDSSVKSIAYCSTGQVQHVREISVEGLQLTFNSANVNVLCGESLESFVDVMDVKNVKQLHVMREDETVWEPLCVECYHAALDYLYLQ